MTSGETVSSGPPVCPACGFPVPSAPEARYCLRCGRRLSEAAPPHVFGVLAPGPAFVLGCVLLVAAVVALVAGSVVTSIVLAGFAAATLVLFYGASRRDPESPMARAMFSSGHRLRGWAVFCKESAGAWALASRDLARLRAQSRALRRERKRAIAALGEATYQENAPIAGALRLRLKEIDEGLAAGEKARLVSLATARRRVRDEKVAAQPTQRFSAEELTSRKGAPPA